MSLLAAPAAGRGLAIGVLAPASQSGCDLGPDCVERGKKAPEAGFAQAAALALIHLLSTGSHSLRETSAGSQLLQTSPCQYKQIRQASWHIIRTRRLGEATDGPQQHCDLTSFATLPSIGPSVNRFFLKKKENQSINKLDGGRLCDTDECSAADV